MNKYYIIFAIIIIAIIFLYNQKENITSDSGKTLSNEALQYIASVYNTQNMTVTNLNVTAWKGMITMWSGDVNSIPSGWALCDGTKGTPDLRGRFIVGSGQGANLTNRTIGDKGGQENHTHGIKNLYAEIGFEWNNHDGNLISKSERGIVTTDPITNMTRSEEHTSELQSH